ncbi:hypothetical protein B7R21_09475 [Subtercola boreus]|uniref:RNA polymerase sigma-70 region 2 domain-containing protein n=1 Tax=Subtercola boreus TaxID=120213 RepID=A0A3E0VUJ0_9MICO|nr:sigma-70 family RNA polymerase sigma factor [Subtercola boreus]RFA13058.1 hypothetical protein B7R21_09475 [Subtercola boreus]
MTTQPRVASFTATYRESYAEVLRFVRRRAHPLTVDDVVSETFTIAWSKWHAVPREPLPWLYNTARNVMLNASRSGARQRAVAVRLSGLADTLVGHDPDGFDNLERRIDLAAAFSALSVADQEVLALDAWEDLDAKAASTALGCSRATYSMRLTRARRRLAALLTEAPRTEPLPTEPLPTEPHLPEPPSVSTPHTLPPEPGAPLIHARPAR